MSSFKISFDSAIRTNKTWSEPLNGSAGVLGTKNSYSFASSSRLFVGTKRWVDAEGAAHLSGLDRPGESLWDAGIRVPGARGPGVDFLDLGDELVRIMGLGNVGPVFVSAVGPGGDVFFTISAGTTNGAVAVTANWLHDDTSAGGNAIPPNLIPGGPNVTTIALNRVAGTLDANWLRAQEHLRVYLGGLGWDDGEWEVSRNRYDDRIIICLAISEAAQRFSLTFRPPGGIPICQLELATCPGLPLEENSMNDFAPLIDNKLVDMGRPNATASNGFLRVDMYQLYSQWMSGGKPGISLSSFFMRAALHKATLEWINSRELVPSVFNHNSWGGCYNHPDTVGGNYIQWNSWQPAPVDGNYPNGGQPWMFNPTWFNLEISTTGVPEGFIPIYVPSAFATDPKGLALFMMYAGGNWNNLPRGIQAAAGVNTQLKMPFSAMVGIPAIGTQFSFIFPRVQVGNAISCYDCNRMAKFRPIFGGAYPVTAGGPNLARGAGDPVLVSGMNGQKIVYSMEVFMQGWLSQINSADIDRFVSRMAKIYGSSVYTTMKACCQWSADISIRYRPMTTQNRGVAFANTDDRNRMKVGWTPVPRNLNIAASAAELTFDNSSDVIHPIWWGTNDVINNGPAINMGAAQMAQNWGDIPAGAAWNYDQVAAMQGWMNADNIPAPKCRKIGLIPRISDLALNLLTVGMCSIPAAYSNEGGRGGVFFDEGLNSRFLQWSQTKGAAREMQLRVDNTPGCCYDFGAVNFYKRFNVFEEDYPLCTSWGWKTTARDRALANITENLGNYDLYNFDSYPFLTRGEGKSTVRGGNGMKMRPKYGNLVSSGGRVIWVNPPTVWRYDDDRNYRPIENVVRTLWSDIQINSMFDTIVTDFDDIYPTTVDEGSTFEKDTDFKPAEVLVANIQRYSQYESDRYGNNYIDQNQFVHKLGADRRNNKLVEMLYTTEIINNAGAVYPVSSPSMIASVPQGDVVLPQGRTIDPISEVSIEFNGWANSGLWQCHVVRTWTSIVVRNILFRTFVWPQIENNAMYNILSNRLIPMFNAWVRYDSEIIPIMDWGFKLDTDIYGDIDGKKTEENKPDLPKKEEEKVTDETVK